MNTLDWNKINDSVKAKIKSSKVTFISGSIYLSPKRIKKILKLSQSKKRPVIWGSMKDEYILGLENSPQFKTLKSEVLAKTLANEKLAILKYYQRDQANLVKELEPANIIYIYGSWSSFIHYKSEFWNALDAGSKLEFVSPFVDESEARSYETKISRVSSEELRPLQKKLTDKEIMQLLEKVKTQSWAWERQTSAILADKGKIIQIGFNKVLPQQWSQMHFGNLRENIRAASQEKNELQQTLHAEMMVLTEANKNGISFEGKELFLELFPCGHCAKILANCGLKRIVYKHDHSHELGYQILQECGVKLERLLS